MMFPYDQENSRLLLQNYTDVTLVTSHVGVWGPNNTINVTILEDESEFTGIYAANGSINVVQGAGRGVYSPCGALNVTIPAV